MGAQLEHKVAAGMESETGVREDEDDDAWDKEIGGGEPKEHEALEAILFFSSIFCFG